MAGRAVAPFDAWATSKAAARVRPALVVGLTLLTALSLAMLAVRGSSAVAELPPAYELLPLPAELDSVTPVREADARLAVCGRACASVLYVWTPRMPLSRRGILEVARATERMDAGLMLLSYEELSAYATGEEAIGTTSSAVADAALAAGALAHAPSLVVMRGTTPLGAAILGYKTAAAYEAALARRLGEPVEAGENAATMASPVAVPAAAAVSASAAATVAAALDHPLEPVAAPLARAARATDYPVVGVPGAYFRWVPGRNAIAYESSQRVYLLDLEDGESRSAPGFIDFVPTPDGRYFVTPGEVEGGLTFYDAEQVFDAVAQGTPGEVDPIFTDLRMRDQYPSVGILEQDATRTVYRVMTSWFEGVVYRDYDVRVDERSGASSVQPVGEVIQPCVGVALSTPIMSQDGREVAGRDEATGTTKIFGILEGGRCEALADFGVQTSKVAWHASGRSIAFAVPRRRRGVEDADQGIFVLDRDARELTRLPTSEGASRLAFPDFVGDDAVVFLVPGSGAQRSSFFRVVPLAP